MQTFPTDSEAVRGVRAGRESVPDMGAGNLLFLLELHEKCAACTLFHVWLPPREMGTMWSMVADIRCGCGCIRHKLLRARLPQPSIRHVLTTIETMVFGNSFSRMTGLTESHQI